MRAGAARSPEIKRLHDDALLRLAKYLDAKGFRVAANHIDWEGGMPESYGGVMPDLESSRGGANYYFEIETCESFLDEMATKSKLSVLSSNAKHSTYAVMFLNCRKGDRSFNGCRAFDKALLRWGLSGRVRSACYDTFSHRLFIDEEISPEEEPPVI
ncbi:MAG: hypothetical protein M1548_09790 [Actinobacteria bacterium]|nr:hypothetical protein [Actinomycetota bacterium]